MPRHYNEINSYEINGKPQAIFSSWFPAFPPLLLLTLLESPDKGTASPTSAGAVSVQEFVVTAF